MDEGWIWNGNRIKYEKVTCPQSTMSESQRGQGYQWGKGLHGGPKLFLRK